MNLTIPLKETASWMVCRDQSLFPCFSILSRDPSFEETIQQPRGNTWFSKKERWLKRTGNQPQEKCNMGLPKSGGTSKIGGHPLGSL